jgi:hypothetical protein
MPVAYLYTRGEQLSLVEDETLDRLRELLRT